MALISNLASFIALGAFIVTALRFTTNLIKKKVKPDWQIVVGVAVTVVAVIGVALLRTPSASARTYSETAGGIAHTWTNYVNAGGNEGPIVAASQTIQVACRVSGFKVADGNPWWYRIAQSPWNNTYYVSADAFYNNGRGRGSLLNTPWYDPKVPIC